MRLSELLACLPEPPLAVTAPAGAAGDPVVTGVAYDSRRVQPGEAFVAVYHRGYAADRHEFAAGAVRAGAAAVVVQRPVEVPPGTPVVSVPDTAEALGWLAAGFYGMPSQRLGLAGVTGTDGKSTTCALTTAILEAAGMPAGMVTTVATKTVGPAREKAEHTSTPEAVEVQRLLADTVAGGGRCAVLESTSHALDQGRLAGCEFDVAVVTNVTHEHLEYHGTPEAYLAAKARLLDLTRASPRRPKQPASPKAAVLNLDDSSFSFMAARAARVPVPVVAYGLGAQASVRAEALTPKPWGTACRVASPWGAGALDLQLPGTFNVYNALAALAAACTLGAPLDVALAALGRERGVAGRLQRVEAGQPFAVIVDFAHTPNSLEQVLTLLRGQTAGKLIAVFGSAGERDRMKRPWMGRIAAVHADFFVITDEDPRLEDREAILGEIAAGAAAAGAAEGTQFVRIPDRRQAITAAVGRAAAGDTVLLAGKGHETSILGQQHGRLHAFPWDERAAALEALAALGYRAAALC
jgi:UDP-N-acetylmuramoyl-L-alanyl-D-glutamate--2,6-diaminopimelate ligase